jgi:hypothetical protein
MMAACYPYPNYNNNLFISNHQLAQTSRTYAANMRQWFIGCCNGAANMRQRLIGCRTGVVHLRQWPTGCCTLAAQFFSASAHNFRFAIQPSCFLISNIKPTV